MITQDIELAISALNQGDIVAIPTETVYGLAAKIDDEHAIRRVFHLKNRPYNHPLIMHVLKEWDLSPWVKNISSAALKLMQNHWPGPLTLVFNAKHNAIHPFITGGQSTVAIRSPSHPVCQTLLEKLGTPLVAPSANPFGKISPTTAAHVAQAFPSDPLLILDGGRASIGIESTIVNVACHENFQILRHGDLSETTIQQTLVQEATACLEPVRVPGQLKTHYQPNKPFYYFKTQDALHHFCETSKTAIYVLAFPPFSCSSLHPFYQLPSTPEKLAFELYYQLRLADESQAPCIAMQLPPETDAWRGINERIQKAGKLFV